MHPQEVDMHHELPGNDAVGLSDSSAVVMPNVTGYVTYEVRVTCPHCNYKLNLNQYPYDDDQSEYCLAEDELGLALFGTAYKPAQWDGVEVDYKCCNCDGTFRLTSLET